MFDWIVNLFRPSQKKERKVIIEKELYRLERNYGSVAQFASQIISLDRIPPKDVTLRGSESRLDIYKQNLMDNITQMERGLEVIKIQWKTIEPYIKSEGTQTMKKEWETITDYTKMLERSLSRLKEEIPKISPENLREIIILTSSCREKANTARFTCELLLENLEKE